MIITMTTRWKRAVFFFFPLSFRAQLPSCPSISTDRAIDPILKPIRSYVSTNFRIGGNWSHRLSQPIWRVFKKVSIKKVYSFFWVNDESKWEKNTRNEEDTITVYWQKGFLGGKGDLFRAVIRFLFIVIPAKRAIFLIREFSIGSGGADIIPRWVISIRLGGT